MRTVRAVLVLSLSLAAWGIPRGQAGIPALYTLAQARSGHRAYEHKCAACHGKQEQGLVGPALRGPIFASPKANYKVRDIFLFLSVNMPAYAPGSLTPKQYVDIMSFLLRQNGFPPGKTALTDAMASTSAVPLLYHGRLQSPTRHARAGGGCGQRPSASRSGVHPPTPHCKRLVAVLPGASVHSSAD
jgi:mono/diheme cytochrome c family protein